MSIIDAICRDLETGNLLGQEEEKRSSKDTYAYSPAPAGAGPPNQPWFPTYGATFRLSRPMGIGNTVHIVDAVKWRPGQITLFKAPGDSVSFRFGGCIMARFLLNGTYYAAHIHTAEPGSEAMDQRLAWAQFVNQYDIRNLVMFQPGVEAFERNGPSRGTEIWGVITSAQQCYAIYVKDEATVKAPIGQYKILKIVHYPGIGRDRRYYNPLLTMPQNTPFNVVSTIWNRFWGLTQQPITQIFP